jgi:hypothetical protein
MSNEQLRRLRRWIDAVLRGAASALELLADVVSGTEDVELHTVVTFRAIVDAVVPETPELDPELGPEHVPGGLAVGLEEFAVTYVDDGFQLGLPYVGPRGNIPLADPIAGILDLAALTLVDRGANTGELDDDRPVSVLAPDEASPRAVRRAAGAFSKLSRRDRLRAIGLLDELELEIDQFEDELFEFDGGLVGQLVVGFTEMIYYSEWQGYDEFTQPPSDRVHPNDPGAVQSWRQTGYPGFSDGYAALRGYLGSDDGSLGGGEVWTTIDGPGSVRIVRDPGSFRENDYDTGDYAEPYPE